MVIPKLPRVWLEFVFHSDPGAPLSLASFLTDPTSLVHNR